MSIPVNPIDRYRFFAIASALFERDAELSIYSSKDKDGRSYVSIDLKGYLPESEVKNIFNAEPYVPGSENDSKE